jgi:K+-sensing histidine kinase KdpD
MTHDTRDGWLAAACGAAAPLAVAAALVPLRDDLDSANVALILAAVVVAVASTGRRPATFLAALSGMIWFDFFHTRPYESFTINDHNDVVTAIVLLVVGVVVGELAIRSRRHRGQAIESSDDIGRIHAVAELVAAGEPPDHVVLAVATELRRLLSLRDCRYEPEQPTHLPRPRPRVERSGEVTYGELRWGVESMGLPSDEVELPVIGRGHSFGNFVLVPTPGRPVTFDRRVVAVALADQAGAALAGQPTLPSSTEQRSQANG